MQRRGKSLDRGDFLIDTVGRKAETSARRPAVDQNRTGAANTLIAAALGRGQLQPIAQTRQQRLERLDTQRMRSSPLIVSVTCIGGSHDARSCSWPRRKRAPACAESYAADRPPRRGCHHRVRGFRQQSARLRYFAAFEFRVGFLKRERPGAASADHRPDPPLVCDRPQR